MSNIFIRYEFDFRTPYDHCCLLTTLSNSVSSLVLRNNKSRSFQILIKPTELLERSVTFSEKFVAIVMSNLFDVCSPSNHKSLCFYDAAATY